MNPVDHRCLCGALLARRVPEGIEIRCRRCRRTVVLRLGPGESALVDPCRTSDGNPVGVVQMPPSGEPGRVMRRNNAPPNEEAWIDEPMRTVSSGS